MILKAGTYVFNRFPYLQVKVGQYVENIESNINFKFLRGGYYQTRSTLCFGFFETEEGTLYDYLPIIYTEEEELFYEDEWHDFSELREFEILEDADVSELFYKLFVYSTDYNERNNISSPTVYGWRKLKSDYAPLLYKSSVSIGDVLPLYVFNIENRNGYDGLSPIIADSYHSYYFIGRRNFDTKEWESLSWREGASGSMIDAYEAFVSELTTTPFKVVTVDTPLVEAWLLENTEAVEHEDTPSTSHSAEITYNGETIAQLNAGETATLSCKDKKMASDVVVKVNEVESKIPEGYVKPEGTLQVVSNNTTVDVTNYAKIAVRTAKPREIETESQFNAILSDSSGITGTSAGDVFMYIGETTDSYENGTLYYLEDTEK